MPRPTATQRRVSKPLTDISIALLQNPAGYIAMKVFPMVRVKQTAGSVYEYDAGDILRDVVKPRARATESEGGGYGLTTIPYVTEPFATHEDVTEQDIKDSDTVLDAKQDAMQIAIQHMLINRELKWATNFFTTGVWDTDTTPSTLWDNSSGDPIKDIREQSRTIQSGSGFKPNKLVFGAKAWDVTVDNPQVIDRYKHTTATSPTPAILAPLFGVDEILVAEAVVNSAAQGATDSINNIFGNDVLLCFANPIPRKRFPTAGYTYVWDGLTGANSEGMRVNDFPIDKLAIEARIEPEMHYQQKVMGSALGVFFSNVSA